MNEYNRRLVLKLCALSFVSMKLGCAPSGLSEDARRSVRAQGERLEQIDACKKLGEILLAADQEPFDEVASYNSLFGHTKRSDSVEAVYQGLQRKHHKDFEEGRVVEHRGWLLSQTEVKVFKLLAKTFK